MPYLTGISYFQPNIMTTPNKTLDLNQVAVSLFKPPFKYLSGYVWDSANNMVCDDAIQSANEDIATKKSHGEPVLRLRGWGRIQYLPNAEATQDQVGDIIAKALNLYWSTHDVMVADNKPTP